MTNRLLRALAVVSLAGAASAPAIEPPDLNWALSGSADVVPFWPGGARRCLLIGAIPGEKEKFGVPFTIGSDGTFAASLDRLKSGHRMETLMFTGKLHDNILTAKVAIAEEDETGVKTRPVRTVEYIGYWTWSGCESAPETVVLVCQSP